MKRKIIALILSLMTSLSTLQPSHAQSIDNCRLDAPGRIGVSLGFPRFPERLVGIKNPKILVIPFRLKGEPEFKLNQNDKAVFNQTIQDIKKLSYGKIEISFIYNPTVDVAITATELDSLGDDTKSGGAAQRTFENSTENFVSKVIQGNDSSINFSGIDAVALVGNSQIINRSLQIAYPKIQDNPNISQRIWSDPIKTAEKNIFNVTLIYNHLEHTTLTHELGHLYGLDDIYGSPASIPYSLMDAQSIDLFAYEQWVLGWLPDASVTCINEASELSQNPQLNKYTIDYSAGDKLLIIPTSRTTAMIIEVMHYTDSVLDQNILFFYSLDTLTPPYIKAFDTSTRSGAAIILNNFGGIEKTIKSPNYDLLVGDNDGKKLEIYLIPKNQIDSDISKQLFNLASTNNKNLELRIKTMQDEKVAAELKAKQDAELKASAKIIKTISCLKGKTLKKIAGTNPKCPTGYKLKN